MTTHSDPTRGEAADAEQGLHARRGPVIDSISRPRRRSWINWAINLLGFLIGIAALIWSARLVLQPSPAEALARVREIEAHWIIMLCGLSAISAIINGAAFWIVIRRAHRLPLLRLVAVNVIATALAPLPFKLGAVVRIMIHRKLDHLPYRTILAWFATVGALALGCLGPMAIAAINGEAFGAFWWLAAVIGAAMGASMCLIAGRVIRSHARLHAMTLGAGAFLGAATVCIETLAARLLDVAVHTGRFYCCALALNVELGVDGAMLLGATYFLVGASAPTGSLGVREGAVIGIGALVAAVGLSAHDLAAIVLVVAATDVATLLALSAPAVLILRRPSPASLPGSEVDPEG